MYDDAKIRALLSSLSKATEDAQLVWTETAEEDVYRTILPSAIVKIGRRSSEHDGPIFFLRVLSNQFEEIVYYEPESSNHQESLNRIWEQIHRTVPPTDVVLDQLLGDLHALSSTK